MADESKGPEWLRNPEAKRAFAAADPDMVWRMIEVMKTNPGIGLAEACRVADSPPDPAPEPTPDPVPE